MTGKPVTQNGMEQAMQPNRIEYFGGGLCTCFCNGDCKLDLFTFICPTWSCASSLATAGEGSFCCNCLLVHIPCYVPIATSAKVEHINAKLGGKPGRKSRMCFQVVCCWCSACQLARAVKNAKSKGFFNQQNGAPEMELMDR